MFDGSRLTGGSARDGCWVVGNDDHIDVLPLQAQTFAFKGVADQIEPGLVDPTREPDALAPVLVDQAPGALFEPGGVRVGGKREQARIAGSVER